MVVPGRWAGGAGREGPQPGSDTATTHQTTCVTLAAVLKSVIFKGNVHLSSKQYKKFPHALNSEASDVNISPHVPYFPSVHCSRGHFRGSCHADMMGLWPLRASSYVSLKLGHSPSQQQSFVQYLKVRDSLCGEDTI